jgi:hypothetical protein
LIDEKEVIMNRKPSKPDGEFFGYASFSRPLKAMYDF